MVYHSGTVAPQPTVDDIDQTTPESGDTVENNLPITPRAIINDKAHDNATQALSRIQQHTTSGNTPENEAPEGQKLWRAKALNKAAAAATTQHQRWSLVNSQQRTSGFQLFYGIFGIVFMMLQLEYIWRTNTKTLHEPCPVDEFACYKCYESLSGNVRMDSQNIIALVPVQTGRMVLHAIRFFISLSTLILLYHTHQYYYFQCEILKLKNVVPPKATAFSSSLRNSMLFELLVFAIHPFPGIEAIDPHWPNAIVTSSLCMFVRLALIIRLIQIRNSLNSSNGWFISSLTNVDIAGTFFYKSVLKNNPAICISSFTLLSVLVTSYCLYTTERFFCAFSPSSCCQPISLVNALWLLSMTILSIGYGDVVPHTRSGRLITWFAGMLGTFFSALSITIISNFLVLSRSEHKVNAFLKKDENRRIINEHAARALQSYLQLRMANRKISQTNSPSWISRLAFRKAELKVYNAIQSYRRAKRRIQAQDINDPLDKQLTMLETMEVNVECARVKIEELANHVHASGVQLAQRISQRRASLTKQISRGRRGNLQSFTSESVNLSSTVLGPTAAVGTSEITISKASRIEKHTKISESHDQSNCNDAVSSVNPPTMESTSVPEATTQKDGTQLDDLQSPVMANDAQLHSEPLHVSSSNSKSPEWVQFLSQSLRIITSQVHNVANEVEGMNTRLNDRLNSMDFRISQIEKRVDMNSVLNSEISLSRHSSYSKRCNTPVDATADVSSSNEKLFHGSGVSTNSRTISSHRPRTPTETNTTNRFLSRSNSVHITSFSDR